MNPELKTTSSLYETDFALWTEQTVELLRERNFKEVDWENVIEEIESLGRSEKHALESQLTRVIMHMLKWDYQPERRSNSWRGSIVEGRTQIRRLLKASPSLKPYLNNIFAECYRDAVEQASAETGLPIDTWTVDCPYSLNQLLESGFMP